MNISNTKRVSMFNNGRKLDPILGNLFQNEMDMSPEDIQIEIDEARKVLKYQKDKFNNYIGELGMMLCFPEKFS